MTASERMRRMRARRRAAGLTQVVSWVSKDGTEPNTYSSHRLNEARSLAMHAVIVRKIERDQKLIGIPRRNLERWAARHTGPAPAWLTEWRAIMQRPWPEIASLLTEQSENAARLRQSTPFAGVLTSRERRRMYEAFRT